jgi:hypothetical protein
LTVPPNAKLYKSSDKTAGEETRRAFPVGELPLTLWVEFQAASASKRAEEFWLRYDGADDKVKSTAIWVDFEKSYNSGNTPPNDLDDATLRVDVAGGLGPMLHNGPGSWSGQWGVSAGILLEFKTKPPDLDKVSRVKFDIARQKATFQGVLIAGGQQWNTQSSNFPPAGDLPNDDGPNLVDEDVIPKNNHIYSVDNPASLLNPVPPNGSHNFYRGNFFEYVRISVGDNATRPIAHIDANGVTQNPDKAGSRASAKERWLTRLWGVTAGGAFVFNAGNDPQGNPIRNFIKTAPHETLTKP